MSALVARHASVAEFCRLVPTQRRPTRRRLSIACATVVWLFTRGARAQTACAEPEVDAEVERALGDRRAGQFLPAFDRLQQLSSRCPSPRVRAQLALAEQALQRWSDAYLHLQASLATRDLWVESHRAPLEGALREIAEHLPRLSPQTNVPGAELRVNGARVGTLPLAAPCVIPTGAATVELVAPGYRPLRRVVSIAHGEVSRETLTLEPESPREALPAGPRPVAPSSRRDATVPSARSSAWAVAGWSAVGAGAVLVGFGVWQAIAWASQANETFEANANSPGELGAWARFQGAANGDGSLSTAGVCDRARMSTTPDAVAVQGLCDGNRARSAWALGLGIGGAALTAGGVAVLVVARSGRSERTTLRITPWIAGASVRVDF